jgi:glycosyltransferase involved in cell wall biosynthesis
VRQVIVPKLKGHFESYYQLINIESPSELRVVPSIASLLRSSLRNPDGFVLLHGEIQVLMAILLRLANPKSSIVIVFYYAFLNPTVVGRLSNGVIYSIFKVMGIRTLGLGYMGGYGKLLENLSDPITVDVKTTKDKEIVNDETFSFLIAGYIDERKSVFEIIGALGEQKRKGVNVELVVVGEQAESVRHKLDVVLQSIDFPIEIVDRRVDEFELQAYMDRTNCILAIYKQHVGSSGFVINSVGLAKPVLFISRGVLREVSDLVLFPFLPEAETEAEIYKAITEVIKFKGDFFKQDKLDMFIQKHSKSIFVQGVLGE